jgi:hypothetical protein
MTSHDGVGHWHYIGFIGARCSLNLNKHGYDIVGFGNFIR